MNTLVGFMIRRAFGRRGPSTDIVGATRPRRPPRPALPSNTELRRAPPSAAQRHRAPPSATERHRAPPSIAAPPSEQHKKQRRRLMRAYTRCYQRMRAAASFLPAPPRDGRGGGGVLLRVFLCTASLAGRSEWPSPLAHRMDTPPSHLPPLHPSVSPAISRGGRIGRALMSRAGDRGFESMVESNQCLIKLILVASQPGACYY